MAATRTMLAVAVCVVAMSSVVSSTHAAAPPIKLVFEGYFGREVNLTATKAKTGPEHEDVCFVKSADQCQAGVESSIATGYRLAESVAGGTDGNIYVADKLNHRVQELTSAGQFVLMFGKQVNQTETLAKAGPALEDVCTAASGNVCQAGVESTEPGLIGRPDDIAVDAEGDVYVGEHDFSELSLGSTEFGERVQKFTAGGSFLLEIGKEVNGTNHTNVCTREEEEKSGVQCVATAQRQFGAPFQWGGEAGAFNFATGKTNGGNILGAGGPEDLLYVGDEGRIQEFKPNGEPAGQIALGTGIVRSLAVDPVSGDVYFINTESVTVSSSVTVERRDSKGQSVGAPIMVGAGTANATVKVQGLAIDPNSHIAIAAERQPAVGNGELFGALYEASNGRFLTAFTIPRTVTGIGFNGNGQLYAAGASEHELLAWTPEPVAELVTGAAGCVPGQEHETDVTLNCTLGGEVNTENVSGTKVWFEWGLTEALGERTQEQPVTATGPVSAQVAIRPNAALYYRLAGEDNNIKAPEDLTAEARSVITPLVAPHIVGRSSASFIKASSAVLSNELNPENASTEYFFEFAASESALLDCPGVKSKPSGCEGVVSTPAGQADVYGQTRATLEASGLQPATTYSYRLAAENHNATEAKSVVGEEIASFTTAVAAQPQTRTGAVSSIASTSAIISGVVEPDGIPASYAFELGMDEGASTQYAVVFSGPVPPSTGPIAETLQLSGLQPGTTYAYRITITSGYITTASRTISSEAATFTTGGLPAVLLSPQSIALLSMPKIAFPAATETSACRRGYVRDKHGKCVKAKPKRKSRTKPRKSTRRPRRGRHR